MEVKRNIEQLAALLDQGKTIEPERLQPFVFLAQAFGEPYGYSFDVQHFKVFSRELEADLSVWSKKNDASTATVSDLSQFVAKNVLSAQLPEVELAAAHIYFEKKGYSASEIEQVLSPDTAILKGAKSLMSTLASYKPKTLAVAVK